MTLHPGDQLDHYRIEKLVARSGMASIYRATDVRNNRVVALKIPHPEVEADPLFFDRFKREEEIGKKLDHPAVMKVYDDRRRSRDLHGHGVGGRPAAAPNPDRAEEAAHRARGAHHPGHLRRARSTSTARAWCTAI